MGQIGPGKVHVGAISFSTRETLRWTLPTFQDKASLDKAVLDIVQKRGNTYTGGALSMARTDVFPKSAGGRPGEIPQIAIVVMSVVGPIHYK